MERSYIIASGATIGSMLQGWHGGAAAGALLYLKKDFHIEENTQIQGLIVASAIFTACIATLCAGPLADWLGRKSSLLVSAILYTVGAAVMAWSPQVHVLIIGRLLVGAAIGLASAIAPLYISECSPPEIRGRLLTFPQLFGSVGTFLAYTLAFGISLMFHPAWRMMLGVTLLPSIIYVVFCFWYLPESPRWLGSKGRLAEAKETLQWLRKKDDVAAELSLLVEGLGHANLSLKEYLLEPANAKISQYQKGSYIQIIGADSEGGAWIATPIQSIHDSDGKVPWSTAGSLKGNSFKEQNSNKLLPLDPLVTVMGSLHSNAPDEVNPSASFMGFEKFPEFDEENPGSPSPTSKGHNMDDGENDEDLLTPLLEDKNDCAFSGELSPKEKLTPPMSSTHSLNEFRNPNGSFNQSIEMSKPNDIGGGWQLGWQFSDEEGKSGDFKTVFLHHQGVSAAGSEKGSMGSIDGGIGSRKALVLQSSSLIGTPLQSQSSLLDKESIGPAMVHPVNTACSGPAWSDIKEPGVRRALMIGCTLQFLQQFSGLNAVLYYTPQILGASGTEDILSSLSKDSISLLASMISGILVIPFILWSLRLMDTSGRRVVLLKTIPFLPLCLILVIAMRHYLSQGLLQALLSFVILSVFICCFVMGFGPIPNVLSAEIFPTKVRGLCNGICAATMWISTVVITYAFPATVSKFGLDGVLIVFAIVGILSWVYVYMKVPETKGMPLEVITKLFAISADSNQPSH
ncbi:hypothetical protein KP509_05G075400 [Ceratopteris richardii]|uniref:Major facilitator superfamily (MFS) profile domain-containing protein n=1 Tax=Ceratopteris richardii TaxID=49495 RepID=A0A8T2URX7_CERRI|nr:hypothetical protein KP509_05G075400 [Ceratopteris richardii]